MVVVFVFVLNLTLCFYCPGGAKPEGHEDEHEMVNMEYACDHCQGLIVGSRINCNVCEDFDLCFGCYNAKKYPDRCRVSSEKKKGHANKLQQLVNFGYT